LNEEVARSNKSHSTAVFLMRRVSARVEATVHRDSIAESCDEACIGGTV
jgi:hypothetical protein